MTINADTLAQLVRASGVTTSHMRAAMDTSPRVAQQWLSSKHPPHKAERYGREQLAILAQVFRHLEKTVYAVDDATVLIRSFLHDTDLSALLGDGWDGERYNTAIQHLLLAEALTPSALSLMVISEQAWPGDGDELVIHLRPETPVFAIAHRDANSPRLDLCVARRGDDDPRPGVEAADDVTAVASVDPPALTGDELGGTGLWRPQAITTFLEDQGFHQTEDWRLSGHGHPIASTTVLPAELTTYRIPI